MLVFLLHGYPNGPIMYASLIEDLMRKAHTPIVIQNRTGRSVDENILLVAEVLDSYPASQPKMIIAHDWGAFVMWRLLDQFEKWTITQFVCLSIGFELRHLPTPTSCFPRVRGYQLLIWLSRYLPNVLSKRLQKNIVNNEYREGEYDNVSSNYFYSLQNALFYSSGFYHEFCSLETLEKVSQTTRIIFVTTAQDQELGFASPESMETLKNLGHDISLLTDQDHFFIKNPEIQEIVWKFLNDT